MKTMPRVRRRWRLLFCLAGVAIAAAPTATHAETIQYPIVSETQLDNRDPTSNFGAGTSAKVVVNGMDGSVARAVFQIPAAVWDTPGSILSAKVWFYAWSDETMERDVRLYPLARGFVEGTGKGAQTNDGATWLTYDGIQAWTTPGGDYNPSVWVDAVKPSEGFGWFSWDITDPSLWDNPDLRAFGALLRLSDESDPGYPDMPRAPLSTHESTAYPHPYVEVTAIPEPGACVMLLTGGVLVAGMVLVARRRSSAVAGDAAGRPYRSPAGGTRLFPAVHCRQPEEVANCG